jgi:hypothetical protein
MKKTQSVPLNLLLGLLLLNACSSTGESAMPVVTAFPQSAAEVEILPTPSPLGDSVTWRDLQVRMNQAELTEDFVTEYGSTRIPVAGTKFMWAHIWLKNLGQKEIDMPSPEHFSVLYAAAEFKPTYGHHKDHADYMTLGTVIFPNQQVDAWLRFDVPSNAELKDLRFVFLPESSGVGASFSSPNYPYAEDHPTYVWNCGP